MISIRTIRGRAAGLGLAFLLFLASIGTPSRPAWAGRSEDRLLTITKTTVYGALLGGLLGVASALVVKEDKRDNAIRWGITLGAFTGCIYGVVDTAEEDSDELSLRRPEPVLPGDLDLVRGWRLGGPAAASGRGPVLLTGHGECPRPAEVLDGGLEEEEDGGEEGRRTATHGGRQADPQG
jgi:hypothetical protein